MRIMGQIFCCSYLMQIRGLYEAIHDTGKSPKTALSLDSITPSTSLQNIAFQEAKMQKTNVVIDSIEIINERAPLKPLQDNPLQKLNYSTSEPPTLYDLENINLTYATTHEDWCHGNMWGCFASTDNPNYQEKIKAYKAKMDFPETEDNLTDSEQLYLKKIDDSVFKIIKELDKKNPDKDILSSLFQIIYEKIYLLIHQSIIPVIKYKTSNYILDWANQDKFYPKLKALADSFKCPPPKELVHEISCSIKEGLINEKHSTWIQKYPAHKNEIDQLIEKAFLLIKEAQAPAQKQIEDYCAGTNISFCLSEIFSKREDLKARHEEMLQGSTLFYPEKIEQNKDGIPRYASYISQITGLLKSCLDFDKDSNKQILKEKCKKYSQYREVVIHFQTKFQPLIALLQPLNDIAAWPGEYELCECEIKLLIERLSILIVISNKYLSNSPIIPYEFLNIPKTTLLEAKKTLQEKNCPSLKELNANRVLLHANIPWRALQMIGNLTITPADKALVQDALVDIIREIPKVIESIKKLIDFEETICPSDPLKIIIEELPADSYRYISLLGNFHNAQRNLKKIEEILHPWRNLRQTASELQNSKTKYAILRTVQSLGEVVKNLNNIGILSKDPIWRYLEELRDLLSHSERSSIDRRVRQFIEDSKDRMTSSILDDFRNLLEYFNYSNKQLTPIQTWASLKQKYLTNKASQSNLELNGLKEIYIFLTEKLSSTQIIALHNTYEIEEAAQARLKIIHNKEAITRLSLGDTPLTTQLEILPLGKTQKKILTEIIKVITSEKAAQNQFIQNQPNAFKKIIDLISKEFKNNKNIIDYSNQLTTISTHLTNCKQFIETSDFQIKIESVRNSFFQLKQEWAEREIPKSPHLKTVEDNFIYILESKHDFINRKKLEQDTLLSTFKTYLTVDLVQKEATQVIKKIQLGQIKKEELQLKMVEFGISKASDKKLWEDALATCTKAQNSFEKETEEPTQDNFILSLKKKSLYCITFIQERLQKLKELLPAPSQTNSFDLFQKDFQMQYALEYLFSDFRSKAGNLEDYLSSMISFLLTNPKLYYEIQENLKSCIEMGNWILHVREATEYTNLTDYGRIFHLYNNLFMLFPNANPDNQKIASTTSLYENLQLLKTMLKAESSE